MEKVAPNLKFVWHSTEIIRQSKIRAPLPHFKALIDVHFYCSATILDFMSFHGRVSPHEVLHSDWHLF